MEDRRMQAAQIEKQAIKLNEFKKLFLILNDAGQKNMMGVLYALRFAETTIKDMESSGKN